MYSYLTISEKPVVEGMEKEQIVFAENQPQYLPLPTLISSDFSRRVISRWTLTEQQRQEVAGGADIYLELLTFGEPLQPIRMAVSDGKLDNDWVRVCLLNKPAQNAANRAEDLKEMTTNNG